MIWICTLTYLKLYRIQNYMNEIEQEIEKVTMLGTSIFNLGSKNAFS